MVELACVECTVVLLCERLMVVGRRHFVTTQGEAGIVMRSGEGLILKLLIKRGGPNSCERHSHLFLTEAASIVGKEVRDQFPNGDVECQAPSSQHPASFRQLWGVRLP